MRQQEDREHQQLCNFNLKSQALKLDLPVSKVEDLTHCCKDFYPGSNFSLMLSLSLVSKQTLKEKGRITSLCRKFKTQ